MRATYSWLLLSIAVILAGCGGGGGGVVLGPSALLQGRVLLVSTGQPPNPPATVSGGGQTTQTNTQDGTFRLRVPLGTPQITVRAPGTREFTFQLPTLQANQTVDLGELYIGAQAIAVQGRVVDATTQQPVGDALITLLGQRARSSPSTGRFTLNNVAYDPEGLLDVEGEIQREGYITRRFAADQPVIDGVMELGDIPLLTITDENPPGQPGNLRGIVQVPGDDPLGTRVDIYTPPNASTPAESTFIQQSTGSFQLWLTLGQYRLRFVKGTRTAERTVTITNPATVIDLGTIVLQ